MDFSRYRRVNWHRSAGTRCRNAWLATLLVLGSLGGVPAARADNPGYDRPGYGFTPVVLGPGEVTLEQGFPDWSLTHQAGVSSSMYSADTLVRVGVTGPFELQLGGSALDYLHQSGAGTSVYAHGHGDTTLGVKFALPAVNRAFSWGLLANVEFTNGSSAFRNNQKQYLFGAQFNLQADERNSLGAYLQDVRAAGRDSTTLALSDNYSVSKTATLYVEGARLHSPDQGSGLVAGGGVAWLVSPRVQLDAGFDRRVSGSAPAWQVNLGVSVYLGH